MLKIFKWIFVLTAITIMSQSCVKKGPFQKDENLVPDDAIAFEVPEVSIPLVKQITLRQIYSDGGISQLVQRFEYDKKNRITVYDYNLGNYIYEYTYDVGNRVIGVTHKASGYIINYVYTYYKDRIVVTSNREGYTIFLDNKKRVDRIVPYDSPSQTRYLYDDRGNMTGKSYALSSETPPFGTHTFDDQKNPFTRVAGYNPHFMYLSSIDLMRDAKGNPNNSTFADKGTGVNLGTKTYTYNADGYPLTSKTVYPDGTEVDTEMYEYTQ